MLLASPENFSENGARPVQILGRNGLLIGWARSFSDFMTVTDNTIVGVRPQGRLTRIAGRDVRLPDGHTVGKTFCRKALLAGRLQSAAARNARCASNHVPVRAKNQRQKIDFIGPRMPPFYYLQDGTRETGLGHWLPGFLRSNRFNRSRSQPTLMPQKK